MPDIDFDVLTLGETMLRLTPPNHERLEDIRLLEVRIGGAESNAAIALARLGLRVTWVSKLPNNPLGHFTARRIHGHGVDVSHVVWVPTALGRMGLYFIEQGALPRPTRVLYDRAHSAASTLSPTDVDWAILDRVRHVHLTGITPALSATCSDTVSRAVREARARGCTVSFDVNYRGRLWSPNEARLALAPIIAEVDLLLCTEDDARLVFQLEGSAQEMIRALAALNYRQNGMVVLTRGGQGALVWDRTRFYQASAYDVREIDRVGAGDAFAAGFLWGYLAADVQKGLDYGLAMAALKHTIPGDEFLATREDVEAVLQGGLPQTAR
ncbi:MAG: sugar kinase [Armatimonadetes bacterium]|nr:sugar kinase [Armatimonadota bacterium]